MAPHASKVALAVVEKVDKPIFLSAKALNANGDVHVMSEKSCLQNGHHASAAPDSQPYPVPMLLTVSCNAPSLVAPLEAHIAHLGWSAQTVYRDSPDFVKDLPTMRILSWSAFWAEAPLDREHIPEDSWQPLPSGEVEISEVKVGGLRPGKRYAVRVVPILDSSHIDSAVWELRTEPSAPCIFTTLPTAPSQVKPPLLVARDRKFLKVKWHVPDEPGGEAMHITYQLFVAPPPQGWTGHITPYGYAEVYAGPERHFKVVKLTPGARYSFWVQAHNSVGSSEPGLLSVFTTQATVPSQPEPPRPVSTTQSSITLQWVAPPGNGAQVTNYILERDDGVPTSVVRSLGLLTPGNASVPTTVGAIPGVKDTFTLAYAGPLQTVMVQHLRSGMHYRFRLRAENDEGPSFWSECCLASPAASPPGPPTAIMTTDATQTSATVSWALPNEDGGAPVLEHQVELQAVSKAAAESMGSDWLSIYQGCISACTISSLQPGCVYRSRVRSANSAGWGSWCLPMEVSTQPDVPGACGAPVAQQGGSINITLAWQPPRHDGGSKIVAFLVEVLPPAPRTYHGPSLPRPKTAKAAADGVPGTILAYAGEAAIAPIAGLLPGLKYQFRVQACNALGPGPWSEWSVLHTGAEIPSAPMPPCVVGNPGASRMVLSWTAPDARGSAVTGYVLQMCVKGRVTSTGDLQPALPDVIAVTAGKAGGSNVGKSSGRRPAAAAEPASSDDHLVATEAAQVIGNGAVSKDVWQEVFRGAALQHEVQQLQPSTRYLLRVAAVNEVGLGAWSPATMITTAPAPPTAPIGLEASTISHDTIECSWDAPEIDNGSSTTGYLLEMAPVAAPSAPVDRKALQPAGGWSQAHSVAGDVTQATVQGLSPGKQYAFRVRAISACGNSPACTAVTATTLPAAPGCPLHLAVSQRTASGAKVKWEEPAETNGGIITDYILELCKDQQVEAGFEAQQHSVQGDSWTVAYTGPETSTKVAGLAAGTTYHARVRAANEAGWGPNCSPASFQTLLAPPGPPDCLEASLVTLSAATGNAAVVEVGRHAVHAVQLRWQAPAPSHTCAAVASYELCARATGAANSSSGMPASSNAAVGKEIKVVVGKATEFVWDELQPGLHYLIRVRAAGMEGAGHGQWSEQVEMIMPGRTRTVTDSVDSMSGISIERAASGKPPLGVGKAVDMARSGSSKASKKKAKKDKAKGASAPASVHSGDNDDGGSVSSGAMNNNSTAPAAGQSRATSGSGTLQQGNAASRKSVAKVTASVAAQKRPKASLASLVLSKETFSVAGVKKLQRTCTKELRRIVHKYKWQILVVIIAALVAYFLQVLLRRALDL